MKSLKQMLNYLKIAAVFLKAVTCKFVKKSPLQYAIVRNATCLDPEIICNHKTLAKERLKGLVSNLIQTKWITTRSGDEINSEYKRHIKKVAVRNRERFLKFSKLKDRSDEFYFSTVGGLDEYPQLCKVNKMVLTLFHGQASVERGFQPATKFDEQIFNKSNIIIRSYKSPQFKSRFSGYYQTA